MQMLILCVITFFMARVSSLDCTQPMEHQGIDKCCGSESFNDLDKVKKIVDSYENANISFVLKECKINEDLFKELKIVKGSEIDIEAVEKYLDTAFKDKSWTESYKTAAEICHKEVTQNVALIQAKYEADPFNLEKGECDVKFMAIHSCISLESFINCPKSHIVSTVECDEARSWLHKCVRTQDIHSVIEMIMKYNS